MGVSKFPKLGLPQLWGPITLCVDLQLRWGLKKNYSPRWKLFSGMLHATCTQVNWGDSWLLMIGNQTANLTPDPSFGHNLCFRCPNGSCEPILDIKFQYLSNDIIFLKIQWVLTIAIAFWRFGSPLELQLSKWEFTWECEGSFPNTILHSQEHEMWLPGFPFGP
jgi:hypothetical protein